MLICGIADGVFQLADYGFVDSILGEESTADVTFTLAEQFAVSAYLEGGGRLFVSGAEIAWDLHYKGDAEDQAFSETVLGIAFGSDDAGTYTLASGHSFTANYDVEYPDVLIPMNAIPRWYYEGGEWPLLFGFD